MGAETFPEGSILVKFQSGDFEEFNEPKFCFEVEQVLGESEFLVKFHSYRGGPGYFIEEFLESYHEWSKFGLKFESGTVSYFYDGSEERGIVLFDFEKKSIKRVWFENEDVKTKEYKME